VANTGTVRLTNVQVKGPESNCTVQSLLQPGQNVSSGCTVTLGVNQTLFDAREADATSATLLTVAVEAAATQQRTGQAITPAVDSRSGLELPIVRNLSVSASLDKAAVNETGGVVRRSGLDAVVACDACLFPPSLCA
jgi:hypothetical protein